MRIHFMGNDFQKEDEQRKDLVKILLYVALTYASTWSIWFFVPAIELLGSCMPSIVGFVLLLIWKETGGLGKRMFDFRAIRFPWYPIIFLTVPAITVLAGITSSLLGGEVPTAGFFNNLIHPVNLLALAALSLGAGFGEELGWRGFFLDKLLKRWSPLLSSVTVGVIWASWHIPFPLSSGESLFSPHFINYFCFVVLVSVVIGHLYTDNGRSVLAAILFHGMVNFTLFTVFPTNTIPTGVDIAKTIYLLIVVVIVSLVCGMKKNTGIAIPSKEIAR